jgi:putative hemolysin
LDDSSFSLFALGALLLLHAVIVLANSALTHYRQSAMRDRAEDGDAGAQQALRLSESPAHLAITANIALTLIKFVLAAITIDQLLPALTAQIVETQRLGISLLILALLAIAGYIVSDLVPDTLGRAWADSVSMRLALPMRVLVTALSPVVYLLTHLESAIARWTGSEDLAKTIIEDEIIDLVESSEREGALEEEERDMIRSVLEFDETMVREIMVPRVDITAVEADLPLREALRVFIESGHSRIPVYDDEIDHIEGLLYAKDLLATWYKGEFDSKSIRDLMRPAYFVPETKRAEDLFREFQTSNTQLAIIVDEFGSTAGVISVEDIVEEIVGDIRDEYDTTETVEYVQHSEDSYTVDASINLHDLNRLLDADLPSDEYDSLGGYLYAQFGRIPDRGQTLDVDNLRLRVESVEGVRIRNVTITRQRPAPKEDAAEADAKPKAQPLTLETQPSET